MKYIFSSPVPTGVWTWLCCPARTCDHLRQRRICKRVSLSVNRHYRIKNCKNLSDSIKVFSHKICIWNTAPIMTFFLWTLQTIHICLSTGRSAHHNKRRRDRGFLTKMFNGHRNFSKVFRNRPNIDLVGRRAFVTRRWLSGDQRTIHQHPEAARWTPGDEIHHSRTSSPTIPSPTFKPGQ